MRAVVIDGDGQFTLQHRDEPSPDAGQVVVEVRAAGLNAADLQQARGTYPAPPGWPADIPGMEIAGEVVTVGGGVTGTAPGDQVMALIGGGGHAERVAVPDELLLPVPAGLSWTEAGGFPEAYFTAWDALVDQAGVRAGDRVLVTGAAGGVGTAMVQIAAASGADVVAVVRRAELHDRVAALAPGQVEVISPGQERDHAPFDVIVELVGGADCLQRVSQLRTRGRYLVVGVQAGTTASLPMFDLMVARARVLGTTIRGRSLAEKVVLTGHIRRHVLPLLTARRLAVPIEAAYPLDDHVDAFTRLAAPGKFGKLVFTPRL